MTRFWRLVRWSLESLWLGVWPDADAWGRPFQPDSVDGRRAGSPLAGGYYGVLWCIQGDLEWYHKELQLAHWRNAEPCFLCRANLTNMPWNVFDAGAPWRATTWQKEAWLEAHEDRHSLFDLPGVSIFTVYPDWLHCKHLGVDQHLLGSVLWLLVYLLSPEHQPAEAIQLVWAAVKNQYALQGTSGQFSTLKLSMFTDPAAPRASFAKLKGKGHEVKHLTGPLLEVFRAWPKPEDEFYRQIELALRLSSEMENVLDHNGRFVLDDPVQFKVLVDSFLMVYIDLGQQAALKGHMLFLATIKTHYLAHICECELNPRKTWNYSGEDMMQRVKELASASVRGTQGHMVHNKVLAKYCLAMHLMMLPP